jgi:hypothetical protein
MRLHFRMRIISFKRHRFPPEIIRHAIWLYARFTLNLRDVEDLLAERGLTAAACSSNFNHQGSCDKAVGTIRLVTTHM